MKITLRLALSAEVNVAENMAENVTVNLAIEHDFLRRKKKEVLAIYDPSAKEN